MDSKASLHYDFNWVIHLECIIRMCQAQLSRRSKLSQQKLEVAQIKWSSQGWWRTLRWRRMLKFLLNTLPQSGHTQI